MSEYKTNKPTYKWLIYSPIFSVLQVLIWLIISSKDNMSSKIFVTKEELDTIKNIHVVALIYIYLSLFLSVCISIEVRFAYLCLALHIVSIFLGVTYLIKVKKQLLWFFVIFGIIGVWISLVFLKIEPYLDFKSRLEKITEDETKLLVTTRLRLENYNKKFEGLEKLQNQVENKIKELENLESKK
jgi:hypothetical protein